MREAPSRVTIKAVLERGAAVVAYDPAAMDEARRVPPIDLQEHPGQPERLRFAETLFFDYHRQHAVDIRVARIFNN